MLKVGVLGIGHLGKFHLNNWLVIEGVEVVGFFDPSDENALAVVKKYHLKRFDTAEQLMDACDAVDIVAPTTAHFELCQAAIIKGKHVFVEKPLANTMDEARQLVKLTKEANIKFQGMLKGLIRHFWLLKIIRFSRCLLKYTGWLNLTHVVRM
jgi:predicted dehydrogenase